MEKLETVERQTGENPIGSVIWLHGLGADGHDFEPVVTELRLSDDMPLRFVFPHAPVIPVTINGGMAMRAWYDIVSLDTEGRSDEAGIVVSSDAVKHLIALEIERGIPPEKIVVAGFSQGGAVAIHTVLTAGHKLAGLMALSSYLAIPAALDDAAAIDTNLPVFMAHGTHDPMVLLNFGTTSRDRLTAAGFDVEWHEYPMAHGVCAEEVSEIRRWLTDVFGVKT